MMFRRFRSPRLLASAALAGVLALSVAGCKTTRSTEATGSIERGAPRSDSQWRSESQAWGERYRSDPRNAEAAVRYARALRALDQRAQAAAVLEQAAIQNPNDPVLLGAYGRALADIGNHKQAMEVLNRAHTPDQPDWRILSVQGAVLDQMAQHDDARRYYAAALKIVPDEPSVLSNLGLSYALSKDLTQAETTLRRATAGGRVDPRVRQNLALVVGLQGRFPEAEEIARADLPAEEAAANVAYLRQMLAQQNDWKNLKQDTRKRRG
jgi:Flp pilus assembly protein TadD